jgi:hypothetical protein
MARFRQGIVKGLAAIWVPTLFLQRNVFPGGEIEHLSDVVREASNIVFLTNPARS